MESESSVELFCGCPAAGAGAELHAAYLSQLAAWHGMFVFAAVITLLPVLYVYRLNNTQLLAQLQQEQP